MEDKKLDALIEETLYDAAKDLHAPARLKQRIDRELKSPSKEANIMKRFGWKKVVATAVVFCTFCTIIAVAAGKVSYTVSSSSRDENQYPAYADLGKAEAKLGYDVKAVETFTNGFKYAKGNINKVDGVDNENNVLTSYNALSLEYKDSEGNNLVLNVERPTDMIEAANTAAQETKVIGDITVSYNSDKYKFYPPEVTPSEKDLAEEAAGQLSISYGSSQIEETVFYNVSWTQDGTNYLLQINDKNMSSAEMFKMAEEVINAK